MENIKRGLLKFFFLPLRFHFVALCVLDLVLRSVLRFLRFFAFLGNLCRFPQNRIQFHSEAAFSVQQESVLAVQMAGSISVLVFHSLVGIYLYHLDKIVNITVSNEL